MSNNEFGTRLGKEISLKELLIMFQDKIENVLISSDSRGLVAFIEKNNLIELQQTEYSENFKDEIILYDK